jgi:hypothetical protein
MFNCSATPSSHDIDPARLLANRSSPAPTSSTRPLILAPLPPATTPTLPAHLRIAPRPSQSALLCNQLYRPALEPRPRSCPPIPQLRTARADTSCLTLSAFAPPSNHDSVPARSLTETAPPSPTRLSQRSSLAPRPRTTTPTLPAHLSTAPRPRRHVLLDAPLLRPALKNTTPFLPANSLIKRASPAPTRPTRRSTLSPRPRATTPTLPAHSPTAPCPRRHVLFDAQLLRPALQPRPRPCSPTRHRSPPASTRPTRRLTIAPRPRATTPILPAHSLTAPRPLRHVLTDPRL